ncbi:hypothetical protein B0H67DRAFT_646664 [Lasiosphaeris hirsuta]|uniref:Uncharacterized protein n=1 Tax=Lasiosphaeris hirsuta TaxID=260670 RepID=A0AA40DS39_9PEZI|nr:hypothetical protein B0H67DRAFT_646664 [Lasiosphaeris hirsuta]
MSVPSEIAWPPTPEELDCGSVNLLHMELLHHFEKFTQSTLIFQGIWPTMLRLAFQSQQHSFLVNAMLSLSAAHLAYLVPGDSRYHRAKHTLLDKALHDYREALSAPITADNCDALLGGAVLVHHLLWCDLSFMDGQTGGGGQPLDLSGDRLYWLATGQRQIFFMAWPLFQSHKSVFSRVAVLQPCMALEDIVGTCGLNWRRYAKGFMELYDNPRYHGGRDAFPTPFNQPAPSSTAASTNSRSEASPPLGFHPHTARMHKVLTLWQSYKEGEQFIKSGGAPDEALTRAAYKRLVARLAIAMAYIADRDGCPASSTFSQPDAATGHPLLRREDVVRYVMTFAMLCFGPLLPLISSGDSRILVLLFHVYRAVDKIFQTDNYWWSRRRVSVMQAAIMDELHARGLDVCLRGLGELM